MKPKASPTKPVSPQIDFLFKLGLVVLILAALTVTFWPQKKTVPDTAEAATATLQPAEAAPAASLPAPEAPVVDNTPVVAGSEKIDREANQALIEQLLNSTETDKITALGIDLLKRQDPTNALVLFERAVSINGLSETHQLNLGIALGRLGRLDEAMAAYQKALEIYPDFVQAHINLGLLYYRLGRLDEADTHYRDALEIEPDSPTAHNNLGSLMARQRRYAEALDHFEKAFQLDGNYLEARFNAANALLYVGRTNEAIGRLQDMINEHPDFVPAQMVLTRLTNARNEAPAPKPPVGAQ